jgi:hypothetical protein
MRLRFSGSSKPNSLSSRGADGLLLGPGCTKGPRTAL